MNVLPRVRKRIDTLSTAETAALRSAFAALMRSSDPGANYAFWAGIHGRFCPHGSALFLPWHRAYLFAFEDALRATPGGADVTLPYWDWTVLREIPDLVKREPLLSERYEHHDPEVLPTVADIEWVLEEPKFKYFGGNGCQSGGGRFPGSLENEHGTIHQWVGPVMVAKETAPRDPLFWFHHSYVDRVWDRWQQTHQPSAACLDSTLDGIPGPWRVVDVVDIHTGRLGYDYEGIIRAETATIRVQSHRLRVQLPASHPVSGRLHIRLEDVRVAGSGEPPDLIDVHFYTRTAAFRSTIALFGLDRPAHPAPGASAHTHTGHGHHGPTSLGGIFHPLPATSDETGLFLTPRWVREVGERAHLEVGAVLLIDE